MTFVAPESAPLNAARIPSIVVLGADALLAALPATPVQVAHACTLAGYQAVIPASWGDELIAAATLRALDQHGQIPAIQCSCPYVAHRLLAVGTDLRPFLLSLVAPPVVLARYLRAAYGTGKLRITYVGRCPGAADESIDARLTPEELIAMFTDRHIVLDEQPQVYDSVIPPDRRRYRSQPGGLPTPEMLWRETSGSPNGARSLVELYGTELPVELAQHLLAGKPVLIDCAPKLGCVCSGAVPNVPPAEARARVVALEPPRAPSPVVDEQVVIDASLSLPASPRSAIDIVAPPAAASDRNDHVARGHDTLRTTISDEFAGHAATVPPHDSSHVLGAATSTRRPSPGRGVTRPTAGALPTARDAGGRQLPRTYVAHRRLPIRTPRSVPLAGAAAPADAPHSTSGPPATVPNDADRSTDSTSNSEPPIERPTSQPGTTTPSQVAESEPPLQLSTQSHLPPRPETGGMPNELVHRGDSPRYAERAVSVPVTPRSDVTPRQVPAPQPMGERPLIQLLTLGLLISMIVLVSAAVGLLVGRWLTQR